MMIHTSCNLVLSIFDVHYEASRSLFMNLIRCLSLACPCFPSALCFPKWQFLQQMQGKAKSGHQIKALILKNLHLQKRQPCTNCCQILTPIICLILTIVIRNVAIANIPNNNDTVYGEFPLIAAKLNDYSLLDQLQDYIFREPAQYYIFDVENPFDRAFVGMHDGNNVSRYSGLLGHIPPTFGGLAYYNNSLVDQTSWRVPPQFEISNRSIADELFLRYEYLNSETYDALKKSRTAQKLPDGSIHFQVANSSRLEATLRVKDVREFLFYRPNGVTEIRMKVDLNSTKYGAYYTIPEGLLSIMDMVSNAYIRLTTNRTVVSGYAYMPFNEQGGVFVEMLINTVATIIFPLSLSLLLPVFLYLTVLEKEERLIQMMRMNGMGMVNYWAINFLYNLVISILTNAVFYLYGYFYLQNAFFQQVSLGVISLVFMGWILSQIGLAMLLQVFLSGSRAANIIGYLVAIWTNLIGATLSIALFQYPRELPMGFAIWPTFSFNRLFYLMFTYCSMDKCPSSLASLTPEMWNCVTVLYLSFLVFSLTGMYLFEVVPQEFGVRQPLLFPVYYVLDRFRRRANAQLANHVAENESDGTIDEECGRIAEIEDFSKYPLICSGLTKRYNTGKLAVNNLNLVVEDKTIFGLLGPNGAGKTTLLSMITGIFSPSSGSAFVGGYSITDQIDKVHLEMGVCPQFDILWPTLTVEEHLYFYARLRGVGGGEERAKVQETLEEVNLQEQREFKVHQLSGGMKRRLSIGISLVGDPRIVFMDEPTTGLDPENRRHLWEVLARCREKRSLLLTTHLMEEAQSLCDRIGIITKGNLRTVGDQFRLKEIYGRGYFISVSVEMEKYLSGPGGSEEGEVGSSGSHISVMTEQIQFERNAPQRNLDRIEKIKERILAAFPTAAVSKEIGGLIKFNIAQARVSDILEQLHAVVDDSLNFEWAISDSTLEDVFLQVIIRFDRAKQSLLGSIEPGLDDE